MRVRRDSDLLPSDLASEMIRRNPRMGLHEVPGRGHAPTLMTPDEIEPIAAFLLRDRQAEQEER